MMIVVYVKHCLWNYDKNVCQKGSEAITVQAKNYLRNSSEIWKNSNHAESNGNTGQKVRFIFDSNLVFDQH